jgi:hypothetical protein
MGAAAVQRANRHFTWPQVAAQIADVYEQVLDRPFASPLEIPISNPAPVASW